METKNFYNNHIPHQLNYEEISILAFDKDNTITPANSNIEPKMAQTLSRLTKEKIIVILTARDMPTCEMQILANIPENQAKWNNLIFGCSNGSQIFCYDNNSQKYVKKSELEGKIDLMQKKEQIVTLANDFFMRNDMQIEQRSDTMGAICPSRNITTEERKIFDATGERRRKFIQILRSEKIFPEHYEIVAWGSTSIDVGIYDKYAGMQHLIQYFWYNPQRHGEIIFFGDGFPWNDEPIKNIPGIHVVSVENPQMTHELLKNFAKIS